MQGKLLKTQKITLQNQTFIVVSNLSTGIYFLNIESENGLSEVKKFIKN